jgi:hypothetical protein
VDVKAHVVERTLLVLAVRRLDHDVTARDAVIRLLEPLGQLVDARLQRRRRFHPTEGDRKRLLHDWTSGFVFFHAVQRARQARFFLMRGKKAEHSAGCLQMLRVDAANCSSCASPA